jgi:hypothetical protein
MYNIPPKRVGCLHYVSKVQLLASKASKWKDPQSTPQSNQTLKKNMWVIPPTSGQIMAKVFPTTYFKSTITVSIFPSFLL